MSTAVLYIPAFPSALPLHQRTIIMVLAVAAHGVLLAQPWLAVPDIAGSALRELSVSIVRMPETQQNKPVLPVHTVSTVPKHSPAETIPAEPIPAEPQTPVQDIQKELAQTTTETIPEAASTNEAQPEATGPHDRDPDYRAAYLDNPQPVYPLVARRMGWQGRVVLDVEVLADGTPGEVAVQQGSGRGILDEAALRAVHGWRFVPARSGGLPVARHFLVPIVFSLQ